MGCVSPHLFRTELDADGRVVIPRSELDGLAANQTMVVRAAGRSILVRRRGEEVVALDPTCPHSGCVVDVLPDGYECRCHGSHFAPDGEVQTGPARRALRRLALESNDDAWRITLGGDG